MVRCVKRVEKLSSVMFLGGEWCLCMVGVEMWGLNRRDSFGVGSGVFWGQWWSIQL